MSSAVDSNKCSKITTAVEFLRDVCAKGYPEDVLKKYLVEKRGLTAEEVDVAFVINNNRKVKEDKTKGKREKEGKSDRPERPTSFAGRRQVHDVGFLVPSKRQEGEMLMNDFLDSESSYCSILQCLKIEYYDVLTRYASRGRFDISKKELDEVFNRIPGLLKFHSEFFLDIKRGSHIARMFVRLFKFFEGYAQYMKDCQNAVHKMRKFIKDVRLQGVLVRIAEKSIRPNDDMMDLLLIPLERMLDYRDFLNKLLSWGDRKMSNDYELLGKAARRIGRVAAYIEKYRYGIRNQNEMNKVQKFLRDQCDILSPDRAIVRRGMMIRRSSGWTGRKKRYVFFLFNDMLLWTSKNGRLQNAIQLRYCEVIPSSSQNNAASKFSVVYRGEKSKTIKLECVMIRERNDWYAALKRTITAAKESCKLAWSRSESIKFAKYKEYSDELSDDDSKADLQDISKDDDEESRLEQSEQIDDPYNNRYTVTSSFRIQEFSEIDPMDDNVSQVSDQDLSFHEKHSNYAILPTSAQLSPFSGDRRHSSGNIFRVGGDNRNKTNVRKNAQRSPSKVQVQRQETNESTASLDRSNQKSKVIRRTSKDVEAREGTSPRYTISLNNF